jgi:hypothetical protein
MLEKREDFIVLMYLWAHIVEAVKGGRVDAQASWCTDMQPVGRETLAAGDLSGT